jgi:hypothetical protein
MNSPFSLLIRITVLVPLRALGRNSWTCHVIAAVTVGLGVFVLGCGTIGPPHENVAGSRVNDSSVGERWPIDDSGFRLANQFHLPIQHPESLEHIRGCYDGVGRRAIEQIEKSLADPRSSSNERLKALIHLAQLHLFEGDFLQASKVLKDARTMVEADRKELGELVPTVVFLQGIAALRQGETENCVECLCRGSCIFPILREAVHQKPQGSRSAIGYFREYLKLHPDDNGVRWLLNVAYMTVGEYPDGVPSNFVIPLEQFRSGINIGRFADVAAELGVNRFNQGGGAIMDDFNNDGLLDLVVTSMDPALPIAFYRRRSDGKFQDVSDTAGLAGQLGGLYCVQTDYNNDGWLDIYVCRGGMTGVPQRHSLLRNNGDGTFTDVTKEAGLDTPIDGQVAAWADYDNDGLLDLFVGGESTRSRLYHNRGDGTFEEVALKAGVANETYMCKGASWCDYDGDGYPDLYVSNYHGPNRLFHNNRDGTFTDVAPQLGVVEPRASGACWFWDYDNDGWPDIFVAAAEPSLSNNASSLLGQPNRGEICRLYRNLSGTGFEDVTAAAGLDVSVCALGCNFADFDNDGYLDLYLGTGAASYSMLVPNRMFKNIDGRRFADVTMSSSTGHLQKGHAVACGDLNRNGNIDLFVQTGGATPGDRFRNLLFRNPGNHGNHWITIKLVGRKTNRAAIGARIKIEHAGESPRTIYRRVTSGSSFGANPLQQTIGIGKANRISKLEILWPTSGTTQVLHDVPVDQAIEVAEFEKGHRPLNWSPVLVTK